MLLHSDQENKVFKISHLHASGNCCYFFSMKQPTIFQTLEKSKAELLAKRDVNSHIKLALWKNKKDNILYNINKIHTLSLYIKGGFGCQRVDGGYARGKQGIRANLRG